MKLTAVTMLRNEADIVASFVAWTSRFVDRHLIVDHRSTDGSREILGALEQSHGHLTVLTYGYRAYRQDEIITGIVRQLDVEEDEWCLLLDADELLAFRSREDLESSLTSSHAELVTFRWRNWAPTKLGEFAHFDWDQEFIETTWPSPVFKCAVRGSWIRTHSGLGVAQGSHEVWPERGAVWESGTEVGSVIHLPLRSLDRFRYKLRSGLDSLKPIRDFRPGQCAHWNHLLALLAGGNLDERLLQRAVCYYSEPNDVHELAAVGPENFTTRTTGELDPTAGEFAPRAGFPPPLSLAETLDRDGELSWAEDPTVPGSSSLAIVEADGSIGLRPTIIRGYGRERLGRIAQLPDRPAPTPSELLRRAPRAVEVAGARLRCVVADDWSTHSATLKFLIAILSVRRYVDLGVDSGASLFAAAQAADEARGSCECFGIGSWTEDPRVSAYGDVAYKAFQENIGKHFADSVCHMRARPDHALTAFDDGSIDLLHIDGRYTYESLRHDVSAWQDKLASAGAMLIYGTKVFEGDSGAWRLWGEFQRGLPTLDIRHAHGLGLVFPKEVHPRLAELLSIAEADDRVLDLVNSTASVFGRINVEEASRALQGTDEAQGSDVPSLEFQRARVAELESDNAQLAAELATALSSRSWRLTAPLRALRR